MKCPHYLDGTFAGPFLPTRSCNDGDESIAKMVPLTQERPATTLSVSVARKLKFDVGFVCSIPHCMKEK